LRETDHGLVPGEMRESGSKSGKVGNAVLQANQCVRTRREVLMRLEERACEVDAWGTEVRLRRKLTGYGDDAGDPETERNDLRAFGKDPFDDAHGDRLADARVHPLGDGDGNRSLVGTIRPGKPSCDYFRTVERPVHTGVGRSDRTAFWTVEEICSEVVDDERPHRAQLCESRDEDAGTKWNGLRSYTDKKWSKGCSTFKKRW
jgi:hypothetical protein